MSKQYFIDYNRGSDSNAGTAPGDGHAFKTVSKIIATALAAGDEAFFANDSDFVTNGKDAYGSLGANWYGSQRAWVVIDGYDPGGAAGQHPTFTWNVTPTAGDWTYDAGNTAWYYDLGYAQVNYGYVKLGASSYGYCKPALPLLLDGDWIGSGNRIYVYAPAGVDPTTYYGSVTYGPAVRGVFNDPGNRMQFVRFQNLAASQSGTLCMFFTASPVTARQLEVCYCHGYDTGLIFRTSGGGGRQISLLAHDNEGSYFPSMAGHLFDNGSTHGGTYVYRNKFLYAGLARPNGALYNQSVGAKFLFNEAGYCGGPNRNFAADGSCFYNENSADYAEWIGNYAYGCAMGMQDNSGRRCKFLSNWIDDCYIGAYISDGSNNNLGDHEFYNGTLTRIGNPAYAWGSLVSALHAYKTTTRFDVANTIFTPHSANVAILNAIHVPTTAWTGAVRTNSNGGFSKMAVDDNGNVSASGTVGDPGLIGRRRITPDSACYHAGTYLDGVRDFYGRKLRNPPDIGALQYFAPRVKKSVGGLTV